MSPTSRAPSLAIAALVLASVVSCTRTESVAEEFSMSAAARSTIGVSLEASRPAATECEVHKSPLDEATVGIIYGFPYMSSAEYRSARDEKFPYACSKVTVCGGSGPDSTQVRRCEQCTAAELEWEAQLNPGS